MAWTRFNEGDEVSIIKGSSFSEQPPVIHCTVAKLMARGSKVVLNDGSAWTQDGRKWGEGNKYYSRFADRITDRKTGVNIETNDAAAKAQKEFAKQWQTLINELQAPQLGDDNNKQREVLETLMAMVK